MSGKTILLAAPTGRAAKSLSEATGMVAKQFTGCSKANHPKDSAETPIIHLRAMCFYCLFHYFYIYKSNFFAILTIACLTG